MFPVTSRSTPCVDAFRDIRFPMEIHPRMAWIYWSTKVDTYQQHHRAPSRQLAEICRRRGGSGCGGVSRMGPRRASGGLGRMPNPGLAVCAGQRTRASGDRAYRGEGALLAKHCFASARTHSRQRLGRAPEGDLQRPPQPGPPRHPIGNQLLPLPLPLRLPASGRHYPWGAGRSPADYSGSRCTCRHNSLASARTASSASARCSRPIS